MLFVKNSDLQWFMDEAHDMYADNLTVNAVADIMLLKLNLDTLYQYIGIQYSYAQTEATQIMNN